MSAHPPSETLQGWALARTLSALTLVNIFSQIDRILPFILAEAIKRDLTLSDTQMGLVNGIAFAVCHSLLCLPLGRAADHGSPRSILIGCILVWSLMTMLGGTATGFAFLAMTRLGVAVGEAGGTPAGHAILSRVVRPARRGLAIGLFSMGVPLGTMLGFAAGGAIQDTLGWRAGLLGAGALGLLVALVARLLIPPTPPRSSGRSQPTGEGMQASLALLSSGPFRWLFASGVILGFGVAPFYAFSATFLIRTHGFSAGEAGWAFGLLQGSMGMLGTLAGGRGFDRAVRAGAGHLLLPPGLLLLVSSLTTTAALFVASGLLAIALLVPSMLAFAFLLPWAFGSAHIVAGPGREARATSLMTLASGLLGASLGPLFVGMFSDAATSAHIPNGLGLGLLLVPVAGFASGLACLVTNQKINQLLNERRAPGPVCVEGQNR